MQEERMRVLSLDHLVLIVRDLNETINFYRTVLGVEEVVFGGGRRALHFGSQKINLYQIGEEAHPVAQAPSPGSAHLCFLVVSLDAAIERLRQLTVPLEEGPVFRTGATHPIRSIYIRDPDGNLIELSEPHPVVLAHPSPSTSEGAEIA